LRVAALFVDPAGVYSGLPDVEVWDEARDARLYAGPWSVVAHPPCNRWSIMALARPELRIGDDGGCFASALDAVRTYGGVLEHPAFTLAWRHHDLLRPPTWGWQQSLFDEGWVCQVDQHFYGHPCRKLTWLYVVGDPTDLIWGDSGKGRSYNVRNMHREQSGPSRSSARSKTPLEFRDALLAMARTAQAVAA
jgi:hypothetical protein